MSRTTLCVTTAAALAVVSVAWMFTRHHVLGNQVKVPTGADTWKVTLSVQGKSTGDAKLITATPLDFGHQHVLREICRSEQLLHKPPAAQHPERREVLWTQRARVPTGPFRIRSEFYCRVNVSQPSAPMSQLAKQLYASPARGAHLQNDATVESDHAQIAALARRLTAGRDRPTDQAEALFHFVSDEIDNEPRVSGATAGAVECLKQGSGDAAAKSRLLVALLRNREIPARLVAGLALAKGREQATHVWVEAWLRDQWLPMCSFYHHYGRLPHTYLVFGFGDLRMVQARNARNVAYGFLVERWTPDAAAGSEGSWLHGLMLRLSFHTLPPPEQRLVEFLLLLPIAALIVCIFRNLIGIGSFGTFAPALLGLAFHELASLPGILVFVAILLIGWLMRRV
ncbi:MAG TPA: transglutaminase domain-containing protein, partial [Gemmataceae bacterium]|nr:transglutaminase domain-containing protein [Gemmataceae bacterium]